MARIRSIHYDALKSEKLAAVSAEAERCYWRLQTHCDDDGRAEDHPRLLAAYLFPLHDDATGAAVDGWLDELDAAGLIVRYEHDQKRYLAVTRWADYQRPQKPRASTIPPPPEPRPDSKTPLPLPDESRTGKRQVRDSSRTSPIQVAPGEEGRGVGDGVGEDTLAPLTRRERRTGLVAARSRAPDPLWDALVDCWALDTAELTATERGRLNKACAELRRVGADPGEIPARRAMYAVLFPSAAQTPMGLVGRWAECRPDPGRLPQRVSRSVSSIVRAVAAAGGGP